MNSPLFSLSQSQNAAPGGSVWSNLLSQVTSAANKYLDAKNNKALAKLLKAQKGRAIVGMPTLSDPTRTPVFADAPPAQPKTNWLMIGAIGVGIGLLLTSRK